MLSRGRSQDERTPRSLVAAETGAGPRTVTRCPLGEVKTLMIQLLRGVKHLHDNWILHRDLKTSNLLLSHAGILKVSPRASAHGAPNPGPRACPQPARHPCRSGTSGWRGNTGPL